MIIEIPDLDLEVVFIGMGAFLWGLAVVYLINRFKPKSKGKNRQDSILKHLEFYENQLIDMKIRLDALQMSEAPSFYEDSGAKREQFPERERVKEREERKHRERTSRIDLGDIVKNILGLITKKPTTSRDIQITIDKTREHTSRVLKRLYDEGYVQRNIETKPFTYSITQKGKTRLASTKGVISQA